MLCPTVCALVLPILFILERRGLLPSFLDVGVFFQVGYWSKPRSLGGFSSSMKEAHRCAPRPDKRKSELKHI